MRYAAVLERIRALYARYASLEPADIRELEELEDYLALVDEVASI